MNFFPRRYNAPPHSLDKKGRVEGGLAEVDNLCCIEDLKFEDILRTNITNSLFNKALLTI